MSDRAALYAAVCANPDDDAVRLATADWFDENGDPARAAFVRARVAFERARDAHTPAATFYRETRYDTHIAFDRLDLSAIDAELAALYAGEQAAAAAVVPVDEQTEGTPALKGVGFSGSARGFLYAADVDNGATFARHAAKIFRAAPVTDVRFERLTPKGAEAVAASGYFDRVRSITLDENVKPDALRVLGRTANGVRELEFCGEFNLPKYIAALADGTQWSNLRDLEIGNNDDDEDPATDRMVAALLRQPQFRGLESFVGWGIGLGDETACAFADGRFTQLRSLHLGNSNVTAAGAKALAASEHLGRLQYLNLKANATGGEAAAALIASPRLAELTVLNLQETAADELTAFPKECRPPGLRALLFDYNALTGPGAERLFACPALAGLWHLDVGSTTLADRGLAALAAAGIERLASLDASSCAATAAGFAALVGGRQARSLQSLNLCGNEFRTAGVAALCARPGLVNLKHLFVDAAKLAGLRKRFGADAVPD